MELSSLEINEIASLIDINVIRKLGLHFGFEHAEIQRYEKTNNQNPSQCIGTEDMLVAWHRKGGTREQLCRALRAVDQSRLAIRIENGEFRVAPVAAPAPALVSGPLPTPSDMPNPLCTGLKQQTGEPEAALHAQSSNNNDKPHRTGKVAESVDLEKVIPNIALDIRQDQINQLGRALGFRQAEIKRYESTNIIMGKVTVTGTRNMLHDWKSRTSIAKQKDELRHALVESGLTEVADEHLPLGEFYVAPVLVPGPVPAPSGRPMPNPPFTALKEQTGEPEATLYSQSSNSDDSWMENTLAKMESLNTSALNRPHRTGKVAKSVDLELVIPNIAKDIQQDQINQLGRALGFRQAQINRYESTNIIAGNFTVKGTRNMLHDWKSRTSIAKQKDELRQALVKSGLTGVADEHLPLE
ncbi:uncharacterized protein LOC121409198 [Lytechinus variegatus]|uniref:uncharacterized protein LOC121409198 n=1 Tax=Lytechinus variegatus TaxID=7654 RepID=UPI001BB0FDD3|nr:uncharacterized protein LOC121409198 [Lytechinus variegatus]